MLTCRDFRQPDSGGLGVRRWWGWGKLRGLLSLHLRAAGLAAGHQVVGFHLEGAVELLAQGEPEGAPLALAFALDKALGQQFFDVKKIIIYNFFCYYDIILSK